MIDFIRRCCSTAAPVTAPTPVVVMSEREREYHQSNAVGR